MRGREGEAVNERSHQHPYLFQKCERIPTLKTKGRIQIIIPAGVRNWEEGKGRDGRYRSKLVWENIAHSDLQLVHHCL
jgi:hypothetical protein